MSEPDPYLTVDGRAAAEFEVRGSRFVGHVAPAADVATAEAFIESLEREYDDATHNVPAYRVPAEDGPGPSGEVRLREYASDDGEPTGSAGAPALNVLQGLEVRDVVAVVTRYYGGTNLGVGGLARSYARAVKDALDEAGVVETVPHERLRVETVYDDSGTVRGILESAGAEFDAEYGEAVRFDARVPVTEAAALRDRLRSATSGRVKLE